MKNFRSRLFATSCLFLLSMFLALPSLHAAARGSFTFACAVGPQTGFNPPAGSSTYSNCSATVKNHWTGANAALFSDNTGTGTTAANPLAAGSGNTTVTFFLDDGTYDVAISNANSTPVLQGSVNTVIMMTAQAIPVVFNCGTIAANGACTNVNSGGTQHVVTGIATLSSNTSTITGLAPAFTSSSTYYCVANDITTRANPVQAIPASASTVTFTNTTGATDNISFVCVGY